MFISQMTESEKNTENQIHANGNHHNTTSFYSDYLFKTETKHHRIKRQADQYEYTPTKTRCPLLLVADYRFFQEMGSGNTKTTINYLVNIKKESPSWFHYSIIVFICSTRFTD